MKPTRMSWAQYAALDALDHTILKEFRFSPAHAYQALRHPPDQTEAQKLGSAVHAAILEPDTFASRYIAGPAIARRSKEDKERWKAFEAEAGAREILKADYFEACRRMQAAVWKNREVARLLSAPGMVEVTLTTQYHEKLALKIRPDAIKSHDGWTFIPDIKTTSSSATAWDFGSTVARYDYHSRAALYLDVLQAEVPTDQERRYVFIAIEKGEPYASAVFELDVNAVTVGRARYQGWCQQAIHAIETDLWPGYAEEVQIVSMPPWAYREDR